MAQGKPFIWTKEVSMFFGEVPPEIREAMEQQVDHQNMANEILIHERLQFFDSLTEEQMIELREICRISAESGGNAARFFQGITTTYLQLKYGLCGCGNKHDKEMHQLLAEQRAAQDEENNTGEEEARTPQQNIEVESPEWYQGLVKYNLRVDSRTGNLVCVGCDKQYPSLDDRMLRPPGVGGCPGCQHKQKWG